MAVEANFDGLAGPTHNYAGLSHGNVASRRHAGQVASPKQAALQGLAKMKALADLGLVQGVLPPQERPDVAALRALGYAGSDAQVIEAAAAGDPVVLAVCSSASAMWTANAATVAPGADSGDGRVHFTPANLNAKAHRALEPRATRRALQAVFPDPGRFVVHAPLPGGATFGDEGAANHTRLAGGVHLFAYGRRALDPSSPAPTRYPARQTLEASQAVARLHGLSPARTVFAQQHPGAIDRGVFHNDVIAVGHEQVLFFHTGAFLERDEVLRQLAERVPGFTPIEVTERDVGLDLAVSSYLFNSQLLRVPGVQGLVLVAPQECRDTPEVWAYLQRTTGPGRPIAEVRTFDLRQSMQNGGGPACLRLRVMLEPKDLAACNDACLIDDGRHAALVAWVEKHYRDTLSARDLADPQLLVESRTALDELTQLLGLGSLYPFQR